MSEELKQCPFCGGEASKRLFYGARYGVYCDECDARVGGLFNTEAEAIAAWNARAERTCKGIETNKELSGTDCPAWLCSECGELFEAGAKYCSQCGAKVVGE